MSLQDDIKRYLYVRDEATNAPENIAAGLERDYYLVKLADLPEVELASDNIIRPVTRNPDEHLNRNGTDWVNYHEWSAKLSIARARYLQARESEAAVLARRRDELAQQVTSLGYQLVTQRIKDYVDHTIDAEDRADAAEAEVARLKGDA